MSWEMFCKPSIGWSMSTQNLIKEFPNHPPLKAGVSPKDEGLTDFDFAVVPTGLSKYIQ